LGFVSGPVRQRLRNVGENLALVPLPGVAQDIADIIGRDQALRLIFQLPASGSRPWRVCLYVPKRMAVDDLLVRFLGFRDAERMRRHFGGEILQPSNCRYLERAWRNVAIWRLSELGYAVPVIALDHGLSDYRVLEILRGKPPEDAGGLSGNSRLNCGAY